jgi:hypothetical protein
VLLEVLTGVIRYLFIETAAFGIWLSMMAAAGSRADCEFEMRYRVDIG